jgi:hypothetical protein
MMSQDFVAAVLKQSTGSGSSNGLAQTPYPLIRCAGGNLVSLFRTTT